MVAKFITDMNRVWKVTRKPSRKDYLLTLKVVVIGLLIVGVVGFVINMFWELLLYKLF